MKEGCGFFGGLFKTAGIFARTFCFIHPFIFLMACVF